jgi:hypothetical protein
MKMMDVFGPLLFAVVLSVVSSFAAIIIAQIVNNIGSEYYQSPAKVEIHSLIKSSLLIDNSALPLTNLTAQYENNIGGKQTISTLRKSFRKLSS